MINMVEFFNILDEYNDNMDDFDQIYDMSNLTSYLYDYGYKDDEINDLSNINIIDIDNFDINDDYFWRNEYNGYLCSGSAEEVYNILLLPYSQKNNKINITEDELKATHQNIYRYELIINGTNYGFFNGIQYLWEKKKIDNKVMKKLNTYFSQMAVIPYTIITQTNKKCYFTEKGYQHYQFAFESIFKDIKKYCDIKLHIMDAATIKKKIEYMDEYQIVF